MCEKKGGGPCSGREFFCNQWTLFPSTSDLVHQTAVLPPFSKPAVRHGSPLVSGLDSSGRKPELVDRLMDFAVRGKTDEPVKKARVVARREAGRGETGRGSPNGG